MTNTKDTSEAAKRSWARANRLAELAGDGVTSSKARRFIAKLRTSKNKNDITAIELLDTTKDARDPVLKDMIERVKKHAKKNESKSGGKGKEKAAPKVRRSEKAPPRDYSLLMDVKELAEKHGIEKVANAADVLKSLQIS